MTQNLVKALKEVTENEQASSWYSLGIEEADHTCKMLKQRFLEGLVDKVSLESQNEVSDKIA